MRMTKKLFTTLLALAMAMALALPAFAAAQTYTITIANEETGHIYEAYQVFSGDVSQNEEEERILANIGWGEGVNGDNIIDVIRFYPGFKNCETAADVAAALNDETMHDFIKCVMDNRADPQGTANEPNGGVYTIGGMAPGYYLVIDKDGSLEEDEVYTSALLAVVGNVTVTPKVGQTTAIKKVYDTNDSTGIGAWQDSADHDIDDTVQFQLTATVPDNVLHYQSYGMTFHDKLSAGLTLNEDSFTVKLDNVEIDDEYWQLNNDRHNSCHEGCTFHLDLIGLVSVLGNHPDIQGGSVITVTYTATLNDKAVIGGVGNPNEMFLEYSNNPNGTSYGKTPVDKVVVFTYRLDLDKVDGDHQPLNGAAFELQKKYFIEEGQYEWRTVKTFEGGDDVNTFEFTGLDDGDYKLIETVTPEGYNTIDDILFRITADHDAEADDPKLTELEVIYSKYVDANDDPINADAADIEIPFTADVTGGSLSADVVNESGTLLPETGGVGTTLFYIIGGVLVVAAVVVLVARRRAGSREE